MELTQDTDPIALALEWVALASETADIPYPDAACLSTVSPDGYPDGRIVLVRNISDAGFAFYTNANSWKGMSLLQYPKATLTFYWQTLGLQLRVTGDVVPVQDDESDEYFATRPRVSQLGAWASAQSETLTSREDLEAAVEEFDQKFDGETVPRPPHWYGFRVVPIRMEFWKEGAFRLHDRFLFVKVNAGWRVARLNP
jgi:pyridoxamine 5'-phosphate oxidase